MSPRGACFRRASPSLRPLSVSCLQRTYIFTFLLSSRVFMPPHDLLARVGQICVEQKQQLEAGPEKVIWGLAGARAGAGGGGEVKARGWGVASLGQGAGSGLGLGVA